MSIAIRRSAVVGATDGVTPALIVLTTESEVSKMECVIALAVVAMMGLYVLILRMLSSRGVNAISVLPRMSTGHAIATRAQQQWRSILQAVDNPTNVTSILHMFSNAATLFGVVFSDNPPDWL